MENQQEIAFQRDVFLEHKQNTICHSVNREDVYGAKSVMENQVIKEGIQGRVFTGNLMAIVCSATNIRKAYSQVKKNKGVGGVDNVPVDKFKDWYHKSGAALIESLLLGTYVPSAVKSVTIPKSNGGKRHLGIPTVTDRIIQQSISQVLSPYFEREFSDSSYGFRPKRSAHMALRQASGYVEDGRNVVVDMDMKSFFDEVNHDRLMYRLSERIQDKILLHLIRKYLQSGILMEGVINQCHKGTPQGSPLSPLLSNIVLDELDKELEKRGHCFVRYADDFSIFVRSQVAGERVKESISRYITDQLKLKVNEEKSVVCLCSETSFLGYCITNYGDLTVANKSILKLKEKVRLITKRNRGRGFALVMSEINMLLRGWFQYFKIARCQKLLTNLDAWIRRKLRCYRLKQCKRVITVKRFLSSMGVKNYQSWILALSGKGHWRKSACPQLHQAMNLKWFKEQGLFSMLLNYQLLKN